MSKKEVLLGTTPLHLEHKDIKGQFTTLFGEDYYVIDHFDRMRPFFMTIVSSSDHWLFISSNGALSAGRVSPDNALFPYYTDDKITDSVGLTGSSTLLRVEKGGTFFLWEPFNTTYKGVYPTTSRLYKSREGNRLIFEQRNDQLGVTFRYGWMFSEKNGIIKRSEVIQHDDDIGKIEVLDGIMNILPYGIDSNLQNARSTLVDAYKRNELDPETGVAMYSLSSMVVDKAEPSEALKCTTVWSAGVDAQAILLSNTQLESFRRGREVKQETDVKAEKGAFFVRTDLDLEVEGSAAWVVVSELEQSHSDIEALRVRLKNRNALYEEVMKDVAEDKAELRKKIGMSDGIQLSKDRLSTGRHFSNVLFNIMRGGTFVDQYNIETEDFIKHIKRMNRKAFQTFKGTLSELPASISYHQLRYFITATGKKDLMRFYLEYLPLSFSRRHGDPSRPWNHFTIQVKTPDGKRSRKFEGNWRDIFQNWEALAFTYPEYSLGMITKFVNASTIDGYNPYRITSEGIDWEVIEPDDPWSYIGYWGDHQVIYLLKFLELSLRYHPRRLRRMLDAKIFTYANVPYRIKGYDAITSDPKDTIDFDHEMDKGIRFRTDQIGSDGKMVWTKDDQLLKVNLVEKLMVMTLAKLYNLIPEAGIWLNTQRPEWNDANNALVGNGVSMVTLYYLRRMLAFYQELFADIEVTSFEINKPVVDLMDALNRGFKNYADGLENGFSDSRRRDFMDDFGIAGEHYRTTAYAGFTGEKRTLRVDAMLEFFERANTYLEKAIDVNRRDDGLYHSYNLVTLSEGKAKISYLYEMLEGQVSTLSAKYLSAEEALNVLNALKASDMFRPDQYSYMLYPDRELLPFLKKNRIEEQWVKDSNLLNTLLLRNDTRIVERDVHGNLHFNGEFHNEKDLIKALESLEDPDLLKLARQEKDHLVEVFEKVFDHKSFTGRSGTFYGYEGLGSIYWHMVSKLLLAVQECIYQGEKEGADEGVMGQLIEHFYEIRAGIGVNKSPELYGAFPTDAYSHTPKNAGVQQPGMTGQVKEDIINRWAVLGIRVNEARLQFAPLILRKEEFLDVAGTLTYFDQRGQVSKIDVPENGLAFTYCQIPVVYVLGDKHEAEVTYTDGSTKVYKEGRLGINDSKDIFQRNGNVRTVKVTVTNVLG